MSENSFHSGAQDRDALSRSGLSTNTDGNEDISPNTNLNAGVSEGMGDRQRNSSKTGGLGVNGTGVDGGVDAGQMSLSAHGKARPAEKEPYRDRKEDGDENDDPDFLDIGGSPSSGGGSGS